MCTAVSLLSGDFYFGRNLDYEFSYGDEVTVTPRGYTFPMRGHAPLRTRYAIIGMAYVQVAVGFGGEARVQASVVFAGLQVVIYYLFDKVHSFFLVGVVGLGIICHDVYVCCFCVYACMYIFMLASAFVYF